MAVLFVVDVFVLPATNDLLLEGPGQRQIYASRPSAFRGCPKFRMLALRLDFKEVTFSAQQSLLLRTDRCVRVSLLSFLLRTCSMQHVLVA